MAPKPRFQTKNSFRLPVEKQSCSKLKHHRQLDNPRPNQIPRWTYHADNKGHRAQQRTAQENRRVQKSWDDTQYESHACQA